MKNLVLMMCLFAPICYGESTTSELATKYFAAWAATQSPDATKQDLENYLSLLKDDVGHQHLPYDSDDTRFPDGKENMREGMTYYLGVHTAYQAKLVSQTIGHNVIVLVYDTVNTGVHPQTKIASTNEYRTTEVLEIEDGKVSVIRKYSE